MKYIFVLLLAGCTPWAVKAKCFAGPRLAEDMQPHALMQCGVETEIVIVQGGR
jgi:hypothetical protein